MRTKYSNEAIFYCCLVIFLILSYTHIFLEKNSIYFFYY